MNKIVIALALAATTLSSGTADANGRPWFEDGKICWVNLLNQVECRIDRKRATPGFIVTKPAG